ncbi:MAG: hypothetical protein ABI646_10545 [Acidobacteriota bacterium]
MKNSKKFSITTESREIYVVHNMKDAPPCLRCEECDDTSEFLTLDEAVFVTGISTMDIVSKVGSGQLHSVDATSGHLLICRRSLQEECLG